MSIVVKIKKQFLIAGIFKLKFFQVVMIELCVSLPNISLAGLKKSKLEILTNCP